MDGMLNVTIKISFFIIFCCASIDAAQLSRKSQRSLRQLEEFGVKNAEELEIQAKDYTFRGEYQMAIRRYSILMKYFPDYKLDEEILLIIAGLYYEAGNPSEVLDLMETFAEKFPDSSRMTQMVKLAFNIGKYYTVALNGDYDTFTRFHKAIRAFEFVNEHDPYSLEAAYALLSMAMIQMERKQWEEAILYLKDIERKQPATEMSAKAEVVLGECYLGLNKGSNYSREFLDQSERYLKGYLNRYPKGNDREKAQNLLEEAYRRMGILSLETVRYYCTAKKWPAAKQELKKILSTKDLITAHPEATELLDYVKKRL